MGRMAQETKTATLYRMVMPEHVNFSIEPSTISVRLRQLNLELPREDEAD